jgi:predicted Zn finger-like uncharacterized protein
MPVILPCMSDVEHCPHCARLFMVREQKLGMPGTKEREDVNCPHCHQTARTEVINGLFRTYPLMPEEEREYEIRQKLEGR